MEIVRKTKTAIEQYQYYIHKFRYTHDVLAEVLKFSAEPHQLEYSFTSQHGDKPTAWTILGSTYSSSTIFYSYLKRPH